MPHPASQTFRLQYDTSTDTFWLWMRPPQADQPAKRVAQADFSSIVQEFEIDGTGYLLIVSDDAMIPYESSIYAVLYSHEAHIIDRLAFPAPYAAMPDIGRMEWQSKRHLAITLQDNSVIHIRLWSFASFHKLVGFRRRGKV